MKTRTRIRYGADNIGALQDMQRELDRLWSPPLVLTGDTTMTQEDCAVILDGTSNTVDYTLLDPADVDGMIVMVKCKDATSTVRAVGAVDWGSNHTFSTNEAIIMKASKSEETWAIYGEYP